MHTGKDWHEGEYLQGALVVRLLFSVAQLARHLDIDPEVCLRDANLKFKNRFNKVEDKAAQRGINIKESSQDELETLWGEVKYEEKNK